LNLQRELEKKKKKRKMRWRRQIFILGQLELLGASARLALATEIVPRLVILAHDSNFDCEP
jgi:hypothetical protein